MNTPGTPTLTVYSKNKKKQIINNSSSSMLHAFYHKIGLLDAIHCKKHRIVPNRYIYEASFKYGKEILLSIKLLKVITAKCICCTDARTLLATK